MMRHFFLFIILFCHLDCFSQQIETDTLAYKDHKDDDCWQVIWYFKTKVIGDSVINSNYLKGVYNWEEELLSDDYSPEEELEHRDTVVWIEGLGNCFVHEIKFTEWHCFVQKKLYYVSSPQLGIIYIFNYHNVDFENTHLVLTYNLRGNLTISKIYYDDSQNKFLMDDIKVIKRHDD